MNYHWNWSIFWELAPDGQHTYIELFCVGLGWTLATALTAGVMALLLGTLMGVLLTLPNKFIVRLANGYVEVFRNIPLLVQLFLWYFVLPELLPTTLGDTIKSLPNAPFVTAAVGLGFFMSARVAVQVSTGIASLPTGQKLAGMALGFSEGQIYRHILLPMAFRRIFPILTNEFLNLIKNSSVALTIGLMELTATAHAMQEMTFQIFEALIAATLIYLCLNIVVIVGMRYVERRIQVPGFITFETEK
jgi:glutamate/aspartate transport system permease protein